ncbi:MAG: hypothetical protein N2D54_02390 [Chloroflexota bacterium]
MSVTKIDFIFGNDYYRVETKLEEEKIVTRAAKEKKTYADDKCQPKKNQYHLKIRTKFGYLKKNNFQTKLGCYQAACV